MLWSDVLRWFPVSFRDDVNVCGGPNPARRRGRKFTVKLLALGSLLLALLPSPAAQAQRMPWARGKSKAEDLQIELLTFGPGDAVHQLFGHAALLVRDTRRGKERLYNYGMFTFGPAMLPNFVMGRLTFWVAEQSIPPTFTRYIAEGRDVRVQRLNLAPSERVRLAQALAHDAEPANREYLYDHYSDNCATRLAGAIDRATAGQFAAALAGPGRLTLRGHTRRYVAGRPVVGFLMMHVLGASVDRPLTRYQELFLPDELEHAVHDARVVGDDGKLATLESRSSIVFRSNRPPVPQQPPPLWPGALALGMCVSVVLGASGILQRRRPSARRAQLFASALLLVGSSLGLLGTLTVVMAFATDHVVAHGNRNVLLATPLHWCLCMAAVGLFRHRPKWRSWLWAGALGSGLMTALAVLLALLPGQLQENGDSLALLVPINAAIVVLGWAEWRRGRARPSPQTG